MQGEDFAYTIQGWVKGINSNILNVKNDIGKDADASPDYISTYTVGLHKDFSTDAASYSLNYFTGDYKPINSLMANFIATVTALTPTTGGFRLNVDGPGLYNGNISSMVTTIKDIDMSSPDVGLPKPQITANLYDQLNRLKQMKAYSSLQANDWTNTRHSEAINLVSNTWNTPVNNSTYFGIYEMAADHDKLGNITSLKRAGEAQYTSSWARKRMDNMTYDYYTSAGISTSIGTINQTSRLKHLTEDPTISSSNYSNDIDVQSSSTNYTYNPIGSLGQDLAEEIQTINWTDAHKVSSVIRTSSSLRSDIYYKYDGFGRRIYKRVEGKSAPGVIDLSNIVVTHYVLDQDGNTMATYKGQIVPFTSTVLVCQEQDVYGSSRLGVSSVSISMLPSTFTPSPKFDAYFGNKDYELTNHLGNVITTVSDRKRAIDGVYAYSGNATGGYVFDGFTYNSVLPGVGNYTQTTAPDGIVDSYVPDIQTVTDYYAFGMAMPGRNTIAGNSYRYGMNGQEKENELINGDGLNSAEYWMYDSRSGRRWENDPITADWESTYAAFSNNPIALSDPSGLADGPKTNNNKGGFFKRLFSRKLHSKYTGRNPTQTQSKKEKKKGTGNDNGKNKDKKGSKDRNPSPTDKQKDKKEDPKSNKKENTDKKKGMAILVSFPDKSAKTPEWLKKLGILPDEMDAGHAGIVIINTSTGETDYFDFGRYDERTTELGKRGEDKGIVRSKKTVPALKTPTWDKNKSDVENVRNILTNIHRKKIFHNYGGTVGALAKGLDYDAMLEQAREAEDEGYKDFGGYHSTACGDATYCAKFARCVGGAGGIDFSIGDFSGVDNVLTVSKDNGTDIIRIADEKNKPKK